MRNLARGVREPVRPEDVTALARSKTLHIAGRDDTRMIVDETEEAEPGDGHRQAGGGEPHVREKPDVHEF